MVLEILLFKVMSVQNGSKMVKYSVKNPKKIKVTLKWKKVPLLLPSSLLTFKKTGYQR